MGLENLFEYACERQRETVQFNGHHEHKERETKLHLTWRSAKFGDLHVSLFLVPDFASRARFLEIDNPTPPTNMFKIGHADA